MTDWLVLDTPNLAWRMFHAFNSRPDDAPRDVKGKPAGTIYGVLRDVSFLANAYGCPHVACCFDGETSVRKLLCPEYKQDRVPKTDGEQRERKSVKAQITRLRDDILPSLGISTFAQTGLEADDVIAKICRDYGDHNDLLVVSNDRDLYQCLSPRVALWNFRRRMTFQGFVSEYGFLPVKWPHVMAIAGGKNALPGIEGVGEISAIKYVAGTLKKTSAFAKRIEAGSKIVETNLPLVTLPFEGTRPVELGTGTLDPDVWDKVVMGLGLKSLRGLCPGRQRVIANGRG